MTTPPWPDRDIVHSTAQHRADRWVRWGLLCLVLFTISAIVAGWRYFPGFSGDHAWYLQVALRVSQGDVLYRDVAWAYGPLPAQVLAALFRWLGPNAAWASAINAILTVTGVLLTYAVTRSVLSAIAALGVTVFATLVGPHLWGGLLHIYFYTYTQAISWSAVLSLAALAAALRWQQTHRGHWIIFAGLATGLALLSKPEFGLTAVGACVAAMAAGRGPRDAWLKYLLASVLTTAIGLGWQASSAGWWPLWRGVTGYSQLTDRAGSLWGTYLGSRSLLLGGYAFWLAVAVFWTTRRWSWRWGLRLAISGLAGLIVFSLGVVVATGGRLPESLSPGAAEWQQLGFRAVSFLSTVPWAPMLPLLLGAGWLARNHSLPAPWWGLWAYAVISNLRPFLTGYANGLALAPSLAVFWVLVDTRLAVAPEDRLRIRRSALAILTGLAVLSAVGQIVVPNALFNRPRVWIDSAVGPIRIAQPYESTFETIATFIDRVVPAGAPIFGGNYGAQWYLLTRRPNPTAFDVAITGLGLSGPEVGRAERDLLAQPPAAVILPDSWRIESDDSHRDDLVMRRNLPAWWQLLRSAYVDKTPSGIQGWRVLLYRPPENQHTLPALPDTTVP